DLVTRSPLPSLVDHDGGVVGAAFSRDGRSILTATNAGSAYLWEVATGQKRWCVHHLGHVTALAHSPGCRFVALASGWIQVDHYSRENRDLLVPEGDSHTQIRILDMSDGEIVHTCEGGHACDIRCLGFSPDQRFLASGSIDATVLLWDLSQNSEI